MKDSRDITAKELVGLWSQDYQEQKEEQLASWQEIALKLRVELTEGGMTKPADVLSECDYSKCQKQESGRTWDGLVDVEKGLHNGWLWLRRGRQQRFRELGK